MQKKQVTIMPRSMQQDISVNQFPSDAAYEIRNMRIVTTGDNTSLCLVNEKGNKQVTLYTAAGIFSDTILGICTIKDRLVLFSKDRVTSTDHIYVCTIKNTDDNIPLHLYTSGNLNFNLNNPIETLGIVETDSIHKVYWIDGINQPRVMVLPTVLGRVVTYTEGLFDFNPTILNTSNGIQVTINSSGGQFNAGVVQYVASYFNKHRQQSGILEQSSLYYVNNNGYGISQDGTIVSNMSFTINITNVPATYEYIRLYRIFRTSLDTAPEVTLLQDIKISNKITYTDRGVSGESVDPTSLFYLGGRELVPNTMSHKDNTLFFGNFTTKNTYIPKTVKNNMRIDTDNSTIQFVKYPVSSEENVYSINKDYVYNSNLNKPLSSIAYFHQYDYYRFGVQFLSKSGEWSEVVYIGTEQNNIRISPNLYNDGVSYVPRVDVKFPITIGSYNFTDNFIAARLCCVYPEEIDRVTICQGLVCPTVYNVGDRSNNSPYAQSSWFARSTTALNKTVLDAYEDLQEYGCKRTLTSNEEVFLGRKVQDNMFPLYDNKGDALMLQDCTSPCAETYNSRGGKLKLAELGESDTPSTRAGIIDRIKCDFGVDKRIVNMYSPELDTSFNPNRIIIPTNTQFRVVGYAPVKHTLSDINIQYSNPFNASISKVLNARAVDKASYTTKLKLSKKSLVNGPFWIDQQSNNGSSIVKTSYPIYPWHRRGSLNNMGKRTDESARKSLLDKKVMSNLRVCLPPKYLSSSLSYSISNVEVFSSDQVNSICVLNTNWGINVQYRGNINKILNTSKSFIPYWIKGLSSTLDSDLQTNTTTGQYNYIVPNTSGFNTADTVNSDPVPMQYRSTSHVVFALNKVNSKYMLLPRLTYGSSTVISEKQSAKTSPKYYDYLWLHYNETSSYTGVDQNVVNINDDTRLGPNGSSTNIDDYNDYFLIGELYRNLGSTEIGNLFGGESDQALANNNWIPCSPVIPLSSAVSGKLTISSIQGDTYFQRYDHLTTYPLSTEDTNQIVDIVSFMVETRINIDGRYDKNRGNSSNLAISPQNFNLFNPVYSQRDNFFTGIYLQEDQIKETNFPNQVTWSMTKTLGEEIDSWTSISQANILDLDGNLGSINVLKRFNNEIYALQDSGISKILFNPRVQISASDGIPIEISNSGKVDGKIYLTDKYGCQDKWSIAETPSGLYFVDNLNQAILQFNGQGIIDLTYTKNMYSWISKNIAFNKWIPERSGYSRYSIRTLYDRNNSEIHFTTDNESLVYNEKLNAFSSFYSYRGVNWLLSMNNSTYQIYNNQLWKLHAGEYNKFFGVSTKYYLSIIANPEFQKDKTFDIVEFRTNGTESVDNNNPSSYPFNTMITENEYQKAEVDTTHLKKKFRIWRWQIGRNSKGSFNRDRIRNPWAKITLSGTKNEEVRLYDTIITYYV